MQYKKVVPCIYICQGRAVKSRKDMSVVHQNPVELAKKYSNYGADEILIFDLSTNDADHTETLGIIKEIGREIDIPMTGAGNIRRLEDVKKLIYAGCRKAALNFSKPGNIAIAADVSKRFGRDKIAVCAVSREQLEDNGNIIKNYVSEIILVNDEELGACCSWVQKACTNNANPCSVFLLPVLEKENLHEMAAILRQYELSGVAGGCLNTNAESFMIFKHQCEGLDIPMNTFESSMKWEEFKLNSDGMIPVIAQDYKTGEVLMMAYMNKEAFEKTIETGIMTYFSRSRNELWVKGETSGHYQYMKALTADCDADTILAQVLQVGPACHTGNRNCFFHTLVKKEYDEKNPLKVFEDEYKVIADRKENPKEGSYTNYLFDKGIDKILKKIGEECSEIIIAAKNPDSEEIKYEMADFLYHAMVLMVEKGVTWDDITKEIAQR